MNKILSKIFKQTQVCVVLFKLVQKKKNNNKQAAPMTADTVLCQRNRQQQKKTCLLPHNWKMSGSTIRSELAETSWSQATQLLNRKRLARLWSA